MSGGNGGSVGCGEVRAVVLNGDKAGRKEGEDGIGRNWR